jgi:hypothetical protein
MFTSHGVLAYKQSPSVYTTRPKIQQANAFMIPGPDVGYLNYITALYWYWLSPFGNRAPRMGKIANLFENSRNTILVGTPQSPQSATHRPGNKKIPKQKLCRLHTRTADQNPKVSTAYPQSTFARMVVCSSVKTWVQTALSYHLDHAHANARGS